MEPQRIAPGPGEESVWDYPRPPALERASRRLRVEFAGLTIADTTCDYRVLETSQPPAHYFTVVANGREAVDAAWSYSGPGTAGW